MSSETRSLLHRLFWLLDECYEVDPVMPIPRGPTDGFWRSQFIDNLIDGLQFKSARAKREVTNDVTKTMLYAGLGNADLRFLTDEIEKLTSEVEKIEVASGEVDQSNPRGLILPKSRFPIGLECKLWPSSRPKRIRSRLHRGTSSMLIRQVKGKSDRATL